MALEIERKFLVTSAEYRNMATSYSVISQGYISTDKERTVRVRIKDDAAFITIKGVTKGAVRNEWEYPIPVADAEELLTLCVGKIIKKTRYLIPFEGFTWEIDEFGGVHEGLIIAEIELPTAETAFAKPQFIGKEVTDDPRFYNSSLSQ